MRQNVTKILGKSQLVSYNRSMDLDFLEFEEYIKEVFGEKLRDYPPYFTKILYEVYKRYEKS